uniref:Disease resistance R13L4/SHOC-2-like LRR domain-containing protein n=1 Tax=Leersia perrieri TaxID=77586 RepID=A0A0D9XVQ7_9ORYZ
MNMLQLVERNSFGRIKSFRMHDIVRELTVDLCQTECFGTAYSDEDKQGDSTEEKDGRRMVIHRLTEDVNETIISNLHRLRSLTALDNSTASSSKILPAIVHNSRYMSVLELTGLPIENVPDAIGDLFNLRHLGLRDTKVKLLPNSIEKLSNLMTLDLYNSEIEELPRGIVKLKKLRHLFAEKVSDRHGRQLRCRTGVRIPKGLEKLTELQTFQGLEAQDDPLKRLGELRQMRSIKIWDVKGSYCERLCASLRQMEFLSYLSIVASDENEILNLNSLNPLPPNLGRVWLGGRLAQGDMLLDATMAGGQNINHPLFSVNLCWSQLTEDPLPTLTLWSNLTELGLTRAYVGEQLVFLQGWFPKLKELELRDMPNLKRVEIQQGAMTSLEELYLTNLPAMTNVPSGIEFLQPALKYLAFWEITEESLTVLSQCSRIDSIPCQYTLDSDA